MRRGPLGLLSRPLTNGASVPGLHFWDTVHRRAAVRRQETRIAGVGVVASQLKYHNGSPVKPGTASDLYGSIIEE